MKLRTTLIVGGALFAALSMTAVLGCGGEETPQPPVTPTPGVPTPGAPGAPGTNAAVAPSQAAIIEPQVCAGEAHTCVLKPSGEVLCVGRNLDSELGDGTAQDRMTWVPVVGLNDATQIDCGTFHTCVRRRSGAVSCWGRSYHGELGNGSTEASQVPVAVAGIADAVQVSLGRDFSCARRASGAVSCWGEGEAGQLGNGAANDSLAPVAVTGLTDAQEISAGRAHVCARKADGSVVCWGRNSARQLGQGDNTTRSMTPATVNGIAGAISVSAGSNHSCALTAAGMFCWGTNADGQLGNGLEGRDNNSGTPVQAVGVVGATKVVAGTQRSCALLPTGQVMCNGYNNSSAQNLGVGSQERTVPTPTALVGLADVTSFDLGSSHGCAVRRGGQISCWGGGGHGRLGNGQARYLPTPTDTVPAVTALTATPSTVHSFPATPGAQVQVTPHITTGSHHVCGVMADGRVYCFGEGSSGRLGNGSTASISSDTTRFVAGITDAVQVSAGLQRTCVTRANGQVACWGILREGSSSLPIPVEGITDAAEVSAGGDAHSIAACARHRTGAVSCWGANNSGQLGNGSREASMTPVPVSGLTDASMLATGVNSACALRQNGSVVCWGSGSRGQLGNGADDSSQTPVEVAGLSGATAITGGGYSYCALASGRVRCWGSNEDGGIGNGEAGREANVNRATEVRGLRNVARLCGINDTACAVLQDGSAQCWGANDFGQTGHNDTDTDDVTAPWPVLREQDPAVAAFGPYVQMGCGWTYCCGFHADGHVSCAGSTPIRGSGGFLGLSSRRSPFPIAAPGLQLPATAAPAAQ